jgi:capsid portal protein
MGFILTTTDAAIDTKTVEGITEKLKQGKGVGNFKNLYLHIPNGKKDGVTLMPVGETTAKDEFAAIKTISAEDQLAAHRVPPVLLGMVPKNSAGFGNIHEARDSFYAAEIVPMMKRMMRVNAWAGVQALVFADYVCTDGSVIRADGSRVAAGASGGAVVGR